MRKNRWLLAAALCAVPFGASAQSLPPVDVEFGYRFTDVTGSSDMYRSQLNEREGFVLRGLVLTSGDLKSGLFDSFRLDASNLGVGPAGSVRFEMGKSDVYKLRASFRQMDNFSALPAFENSLLSQGVVPGPHTQDRKRRAYDLELEILPGGAISPFVGFSYDKVAGVGTTTYFVGQDSFRLAEDVNDSEREIRGGVSINAGPVAAVLTQGWRKYTGTSYLTLAPGAGGGLGSGTVLGVDPRLNEYSRLGTTEVTSPITNAVVTVRAFDRLKLVGDYVRTKGDSDATDSESLGGNLVGFEIQRFFKGLNQSVTSEAQSTFAKGGVRLELDLGSHVDVTASFHRSDRDLTGMALISSLYIGATMYTGFDPKDVQKLIEGHTSLDRQEDVLSVAVSARGAGPFSVRAGYSRISQDLTVEDDPSGIVIPGGQGGIFERIVDRFDAAASFTKWGLTLGAEYRLESADKAFVRVDLVDRERFRLRASYTPAPVPWLRVWGTVERTDIDNNLEGSGYTALLKDYEAGLEVSPWRPFTLRGSFSKFSSSSSIPIIRPELLVTDLVSNLEDGKAYEVSARFDKKPVALEAGWGHYRNEGSLGFELDRLRVRGELDIHQGIGIAAEIARDKYTEKPFFNGDYDGSRFGLFIRFRN